MVQKAPYVVDAQSASPSATFIFLHGFGDDAEGLPLGLAQQFQMHSKLPHIKWLLPNAPENRDAMGQAWYVPRAFPSPMKPRVPGHDDDDDDQDEDEDGILKSVDYLDGIVAKEIEEVGNGKRIVVGGFSQGCAISLLWGLIGKHAQKIGGIVGLSGYLPIAAKIEKLREKTRQEMRVDIGGKGGGDLKWFLAHGSRDMMVPGKMFRQEVETVRNLANDGRVEEKLYEGMGHATSGAEIRDLYNWLEEVVPQKR